MATTTATLPVSQQRILRFEHGSALGICNRWDGGQYCAVLTGAGIVGCGIFDMRTAAEFGQAIAIARGTPARPLVQPEDLFNATIVDCTPKALEMGVKVGMQGRAAIEQM